MRFLCTPQVRKSKPSRSSKSVSFYCYRDPSARDVIDDSKEYGIPVSKDACIASPACTSSVENVVCLTGVDTTVENDNVVNQHGSHENAQSNVPVSRCSRRLGSRVESVQLLPKVGTRSKDSNVPNSPVCTKSESAERTGVLDSNDVRTIQTSATEEHRCTRSRRSLQTPIRFREYADINRRSSLTLTGVTSKPAHRKSAVVITDSKACSKKSAKLTSEPINDRPVVACSTSTRRSAGVTSEPARRSAVAARVPTHRKSAAVTSESTCLPLAKVIREPCRKKTDEVSGNVVNDGKPHTDSSGIPDRDSKVNAGCFDVVSSCSQSSVTNGASRKLLLLPSVSDTKRLDCSSHQTTRFFSGMCIGRRNAFSSPTKRHGRKRTYSESRLSEDSSDSVKETNSEPSPFSMKNGPNLQRTVTTCVSGQLRKNIFEVAKVVADRSFSNHAPKNLTVRTVPDESPRDVDTLGSLSKPKLAAEDSQPADPSHRIHMRHVHFSDRHSSETSLVKADGGVLPHLRSSRPTSISPSISNTKIPRRRANRSAEKNRLGKTLQQSRADVSNSVKSSGRQRLLHNSDATAVVNGKVDADANLCSPVDSRECQSLHQFCTLSPHGSAACPKGCGYCVNNAADFGEKAVQVSAQDGKLDSYSDDAVETNSPLDSGVPASNSDAPASNCPSVNGLSTGGAIHSNDAGVDANNDDDDLPALLTEVDETFDAGDLIWVKFGRHPFWPSIVVKRSSVKKKKRVQYLFIDDTSDGKPQTNSVVTCDYNPKKMFPIGKDYKKLKAEGLESGSDNFEAVIDKVDDYLSKLVSSAPPQIDTDNDLKAVLEFFNLSLKPNRADGRCKGDVCSLTDYNISAGGVGYTGVYDGGLFIHNDDEKVLSSDDLSPTSNVDRAPVSSAEHLYPDHVQQIIATRRQHNQALLNYINTDVMKNHLFSIEDGLTESHYCADFASKNLTSRGRIELRSLGFGPISEDSDMVEKMVEILEGYMTEYTAIHEKPTCNLQYILNAWVPEAIVTALQNVDGLPRDEAERRFSEGVKWTDEEFANKRREILDVL